MARYFKTFLLLIAVFFCNQAVADVVTRYRLVTDASTLNAGDKIIIVNKSHNRAMRIDVGSTSVEGTPVSWDGDDILPTDSLLVLTLESKGSNYWYFKMSDGYYLCSSSTAGSLSKTNKTTSKTDYRKVSISIDSKNNEATIKFTEHNTYQIKYRWNPATTSYNIFRLYKSETTYSKSEVYIYRSVEVETPDNESITLDGNSQTANNGTTIAAADASTSYDVTVQRTFVGDGGWYTLCLPFALTADDIADTFKASEFYGFTSVTKNGNNETALNFSKVTTTEAGTPYLVMIPDGTTIENPVFQGKAISSKEPKTITQTLADNAADYQFVGIYDSESLENKSTAHFVSANGKSFVKPNGDGSMLKGLRAYFLMPTSTSNAKLGIAGQTTNISVLGSTKESANQLVFSIDGRRIDSDKDRLPRGMYIVGGKKIVIK